MARRKSEAERWRRLVEREQLVSAMNATKWRETVEAMIRFPGGPPGFRIKDLLGSEPQVDSWDHEWYYHPRPWETIEWLEIQPDARHSDIVAVLKAIGVPISIEDNRIRLWGWLRSRASLTFI